ADGDPEEIAPTLPVTARDGSVFKATPSNWSTPDVGKKGAQTVDFTTQGVIPAEKYRLVVSGAGIRSKPFCVRLTADQFGTLPDNISISCRDNHDNDDGKDEMNVANM